MGKHGGVGGDDDNDRAAIRVRFRRCYGWRLKGAAEAKLASPAMVGLDEHADDVSVDEPRTRSDSAFVAVADHARSSTDVALEYESAGRCVQCLKNMLGFDVKAVDVVEGTIVGLGHDRQMKRLKPSFLKEPLNDGVSHGADA